jgi:uncharacterized protein
MAFRKRLPVYNGGMNYDRAAPWTMDALSALKNEYAKMAQMYIEWTKDEEKFYLSPFDMKILSHLKGAKYNSDRRKMMINQPSVAPDGRIYTSSRFLGDEAFVIGDVCSGVDADKRDYLHGINANLPEPCLKCALRQRCNYADDGLSRAGDRFINDVSPVQCAHEQIITPIADYVAEKLYKEKNAIFMHKHYNEMYPIISLIEDYAK